MTVYICSIKQTLSLMTKFPSSVKQILINGSGPMLSHTFMVMNICSIKQILLTLHLAQLNSQTMYLCSITKTLMTLYPYSTKQTLMTLYLSYSNSSYNTLPLLKQSLMTWYLCSKQIYFPGSINQFCFNDNVPLLNQTISYDKLTLYLDSISQNLMTHNKQSLMTLYLCSGKRSMHCTNCSINHSL